MPMCAPQPQRQGDKEVPDSLSRRFLHLRLTIPAILVFGLATILGPSAEFAGENFIFYFPSSHQALPFASSGDAKYLPVIQVLNLMGKVGGIQEKKKSIRIFFNSTEIDLQAQDPSVQIGKERYSLPQPVYFVNGQWMVPVAFLTTVVPRLTHQAVEYQEGTDRIFIGDVRPASFTVRLEALANGARLAVQFTDTVSVRTASSNGKWVLYLGDRPMEPMESSYHFQNPYISNLQFDDQDGVPKLVVAPSSTGLNFFPVLADGGKILFADVVKPAASIVQEPASAIQPAGPSPQIGTAGQTPQSPEEAPGTPASAPLPVVVLDAGHGGDDHGGHSNDGVMEKDLMAIYVARVRAALLASGKYRVVLTRTGDVNMSAEQRAQAANTSSAIYFLSFHAGDLGGASPRIAIFTFQPPDGAPPADSSASAVDAGPVPVSNAPKVSPPFMRWREVQQARLGQSVQFAQALQQQFAAINDVEVIPAAGAPLLTLRSVNAPAAAIELGRLAPDATSTALTDSAFQQQFAIAIVQALASYDKGGNSP